MAGKVLKLVPGGAPSGDPLVRRQFAGHLRVMRRMGAWKSIKAYGIVMVTDDGSTHTPPTTRAATAEGGSSSSGLWTACASVCTASPKTR